MTLAQQVERVGNTFGSSSRVVIDRVELLRQILAEQQQRPVSYDEAQEIGDSLIAFYQILAEEADDDSEG